MAPQVVRLRAPRSKRRPALVWLYSFGTSPLWLLLSERSSVHPLPQGEPVSVYTLTFPPHPPRQVNTSTSHHVFAVPSPVPSTLPWAVVSPSHWFCLCSCPTFSSPLRCQNVLSKVRFKSDFASHTHLCPPCPLSSLQWPKLAPKTKSGLLAVTCMAPHVLAGADLKLSLFCFSEAPSS